MMIEKWCCLGKKKHDFPIFYGIFHLRSNIPKFQTHEQCYFKIQYPLRFRNLDQNTHKQENGWRVEMVWGKTHGFTNSKILKTMVFPVFPHNPRWLEGPQVRGRKQRRLNVRSFAGNGPSGGSSGHKDRTLGSGNQTQINQLPFGYVKIAIENDHRNSGFSHKQWWFSIAMLIYQRVSWPIHDPINLPLYQTHGFSMVLEYESQHLPHFYEPNVGKYTIHGASGKYGFS